MAISASTRLTTSYGVFTVSYHQTVFGECISFRYGNLKKIIPVVRLHSACLFSEVFSSLHCDCADQLTGALNRIIANKSGVLIYTFDEGRGIGLEHKIESMNLQRIHNIDTVEAFKRLGLTKPDYRTYDLALAALDDLHISKTIHLFSSNPAKAKALKHAGYKILDYFDIDKKTLGLLALKERVVKQKKLGYK